MKNRSEMKSSENSAFLNESFPGSATFYTYWTGGKAAPGTLFGKTSSNERTGVNGGRSKLEFIFTSALGFAIFVCSILGTLAPYLGFNFDSRFQLEAAIGGLVAGAIIAYGAYKKSAGG